MVDYTVNVLYYIYGSTMHYKLANRRKHTMNADSEKIIEKIKKVLELSKNNPSENEAQAAALKAQELMAQYHISLADVEDIQDIENIVEERVAVGAGKKWKYSLAGAIARNFRCRYFFYGKTSVVFYGYETDAKIAAQTFEYLFKVGHTKALKERLSYKEEGLHSDGIYNNFCKGFVQGVKDALDKQCTALMVVVPKEVNEACDKRLEGCKHSISSSLDLSCYYGSEVRQRGYTVGRSAMASREIEAK